MIDKMSISVSQSQFTLNRKHGEKKDVYKLEGGKKQRGETSVAEMVELDQSETVPTSDTISLKKKQLLSTVMKRTTEWIYSQELPTDITVNAGGASLALHKFPLVSKCGYIKKLVAKANDKGLSVIDILDVPGGMEAFELAAKFCYGVNFEISIKNIAMLRCAAEYLEMTEDYTVGNLVSRTEAYLKEVALKSLPGAISVLQKSEKLLPMAEKVKLVSRCIDAVAFLVTKESRFYSPSRTENCTESANSSLGFISKPIVDWWAEDLTVLSIDIFQRVVMAMTATGFKQHALGPVLVLYVQNSLRGLEIFGKAREKIDPKLEHEKRIMLETIVGLLPREKDTVSVSLLSVLLRASKYLETMVSCWFDLEKRIGLQLEQAVLDDLLIPSFSVTGDTLFDVDTVIGIATNYLKYKMESKGACHDAGNSYVHSPTSDMERFGRLMESYLTEIAFDRNLSVSKFIIIARLFSEQARKTDDAMYRSIDIYLKSHPTLSEMEKKKICSLMNFQKLSREASSHAAQNDRLPMQTVVQVLYNEQQKLREVVSDNLMCVESPPLPLKVNVLSPNFHPVPTDCSGLQRENEELKVELFRMQMRLKEMEKSAGNIPLIRSSTSTTTNTTPLSTHKSQLPRMSIINSLSKRLGKLYPFMRLDGDKTTVEKNRIKAKRERRHSIS